MRRVLLVAAVLCVCRVAAGEIPQVMGYQGRITDNAGVPVADGTYDMRFRIYDNSGGSGSPLWDSGTHSEQLADGIFNVLLGETPHPGLNLAFDQDYWLAVTFDGEVQLPLRRLDSTGYAYMASGLVAGTEVSGAVTTGTYSALKATNTASGFAYGVSGEIAAASGRAVYGCALATTGTTYGVFGINASTGGRGVYGHAWAATGQTYGVQGESLSTGGRGVAGWATANSGNNYGVYGRSSSSSGTGVYGWAALTTGVTYGVYGQASSPSGYGVYYSGGLAGTGTKSCVVKTSQGPTVLYCQESPECWFEDFGEGQLVSGRAHVELDPLFLETVTIDEINPMKVFVQLRDDCKGMYVKTETRGFDIIELQGGTSSAAFAYRVVAKRKGFEEKRLDYCKAAETDSYLYPQLREKELREHEEERARMEQERLRMEEERDRRADERARMESERAGVIREVTLLQR